MLFSLRGRTWHPLPWAWIWTEWLSSNQQSKQKLQYATVKTCSQKWYCGFHLYSISPSAPFPFLPQGKLSQHQELIHGEAQTARKWGELLAKTLEELKSPTITYMNSSALVEAWNAIALTSSLTVTLRPWPEPCSQATPIFLTLENSEIISVCCLKLQSF